MGGEEDEAGGDVAFHWLIGLMLLSIPEWEDCGEQDMKASGRVRLILEPEHTQVDRSVGWSGYYMYSLTS